MDKKKMAHSLFRLTITVMTAIAFSLSCGITQLHAQMLPPMRISDMYNLASQGNVRALRLAVQRGLNIDTTDKYGNTGMCHAIRQRNYTAYNAFRAAGANSRHPCTQMIPSNQYDTFMASNRVSPVGATSREAYSYFNEGEFVVSNTVWWTLGTIAVAGIAIAAFSGGGGGSKGGGGGGGGYAETNDSLGEEVGKTKPQAPGTGYTQKIIHSANDNSSFTNEADFEIKNDSQVYVEGTTDLQDLSELIDLNKSVMNYTNYLQTGIKATNKSTVNNGKTDGTSTVVVKVGNNAVGMAAFGESNATNYDTIEVVAQNAAFAMIGSSKSVITNKGSLLVSLINAVTPNTNYQINGMYVDTASTAVNDGIISGIVNTEGTLIGMQGRLLNQEKTPDPTKPTKLINNNSIDIGVTAENVALSSNLIGMGSFVDEDFINGNKRFSRAGFVEINNTGTIDLEVALVGTGSYSADVKTGSKGIVGIHAGANTTATNSGTINVDVAGTVVGAHAGMRAIYGGNISNSNRINITGGEGGYGMLGVRGEGTNYEIDTRVPTLLNTASGEININSLNGFGMATYFGGTLTNDGVINLAQKGTGIFANGGVIRNGGTININNNGNGIETGVNGGSVYNTNTINIYNANDARGVFLANGMLNNSGTIKIHGGDASYGVYASKGNALSSGIIDILSTNSYGMYSEAANLTNNGAIHMRESGTAMFSKTGTLTNSNDIFMYNGGTAMMTESGTAGNTGDLNFAQAGTGMSTATGIIINTGIGNIYIDYGGVGMETTNTGRATNEGNIEVTNVAGVGMRNTSTGRIINDVSGIITVEGNGTAMEGGAGTATNSGIINTTNTNNKAMTSTTGTAANQGLINISGSNSYGMYTTNGTIRNEEAGTIVLDTVAFALGSTEMYVNGTGSAYNLGTLGTISSGVANHKTMHITGGGSGYNQGTIDVAGLTSYGMYTDNGSLSNSGEINVRTDSTSFSNLTAALMATGSGSMATNDTHGAINLLSATGNRFVGGIISDNGASAVNNGNISYTDTTTNNTILAMYATAGGNIRNNNRIELNAQNGDRLYGMYVDGAGSASNYSNIYLLNEGNSAHSLYGMYSGNGGELVNHYMINVFATDGDVYGMYVNGTGSATNNKDIEITTSIPTTTTNILAGMYVNGGGVATNNSRINIIAGDSKNAYGMYSRNGGEIQNASGANIKIIGASSSSAGMKVEGSGEAVNDGTIEISASSSSSGAELVGILVDGTGIATNNGTIIIDGNNADNVLYGMKAINGGTIVNTGTIDVSLATTGTNMVGMIASGTGSNITNSGTIRISDVNLDSSSCVAGTGCNQWIQVSGGATFTNTATFMMTGLLDFSSIADSESFVEVGKGGTFEADVLSGKVYAASSIVMEGNEDKYTNEKSFVGDSQDLEIASSSAMFDAELQSNEDGSTDVVMTRKSFDSLLDDQQIASYLESNYAAGNGTELFQAFKSSNNLQHLGSAVIKNLGLDLIPNFAKQNLDVVKSLNNQVNEAIFANKDTKEIRVMTGYDFFNRDQDGTKVFTGYKDNAHSAFAVVDKAYDNNFRYGAGIGLTKYKSEYDNGSSRDEVIIQAFAPISANFEDVKFLSVPRVGFGSGAYKRKVDSERFDADTKNYYYGITNEIRKEFDLGLLQLEPLLEFNVLGLYQDKTKEKNKIEVDATNNLSIEGGIGLYATKEFKLANEDKVKFRFGGTYYHEFNNPYQASDARMSGMAGAYHMESYDPQRNRGLISARVEYQRELLTFYFQLSQYIEDQNAYSFNTGIGYKF